MRFYSTELAGQVRSPLAGDAGEPGPAARRSCCVLPWASFTVICTYNKSNPSDPSVLPTLSDTWLISFLPTTQYWVVPEKVVQVGTEAPRRQQACSPGSSGTPWLESH